MDVFLTVYLSRESQRSSPWSLQWAGFNENEYTDMASALNQERDFHYSFLFQIISDAVIRRSVQLSFTRTEVHSLNEASVNSSYFNLNRKKKDSTGLLWFNLG